MGKKSDNNILVSLHGKECGITKEGSLVIKGQQVAQATKTDLWKYCPADGVDPGLTYTFFDDFIYNESATVSALNTYTSTDDSGTGTNAYQDAAGGVFNVVTAASDNDHHAMSTVNETFKFAAGKRMWLEARVKVDEATADPGESTWWVGLTDTLTTGGMQANALGPLASYDGALFFKSPETGYGVNFETSNAGTQVTSTDVAVSADNTWTRVGFYFDGTATTSTITPYVAVNDSNTFVAGTPHSITLSGLEEMHLVFGIKAGPTAAAETLQIDYIKVVAER